MVVRYGIQTEFAAAAPARAAPHVNFTFALVGRLATGATATPGVLQRETAVPADDKYGAASLITSALKVIEHIETAPVIVVPLASAGTFADVDASGALTISLRQLMLGMTAQAALGLGGEYPHLVLAPGLFTGATSANADLTALKGIAKVMQSYIYTDAKAATQAEAQAWAAANLAPVGGDLQRVRAACNTFDSPYGNGLPASILLAAMTADVQTTRLGEDVMNRPLPVATAVSPEWSFDTGDQSTAGQVLAATHYLTPIVRNHANRVFWGRQGAPGDLGDYGYQFVVGEVLRGLKRFFDGYLGRDMPPSELSVLCSIFTERLRSRVNRGELFDAVCIPDPRFGGGTGVDPSDNAGYALLGLERTPYAGRFHFQLHTGSGAVALVEGI